MNQLRRLRTWWDLLPGRLEMWQLRLEARSYNWTVKKMENLSVHTLFIIAFFLNPVRTIRLARYVWKEKHK